MCNTVEVFDSGYNQVKLGSENTDEVMIFGRLKTMKEITCRLFRLRLNPN